MKRGKVWMVAAAAAMLCAACVPADGRPGESAVQVNYAGGKELKASGHEMSPHNYNQAHAALSEYLLALVE